MQFTDSHHHLQDYKTKNAQQILSELKKLGFAKIVCVSSHPNDWDKVAEIAKKNPEMVIPAFGVHPWYIKEIQQSWEQKLEKLLLKFPSAQIGECGLDRLKAPVWEGQIEIFEKQINLARCYSRPLNIHLLKTEEDFQIFWRKMPQKYMFHSFSGSLEFLKKALDNGAYISLSTMITKRKNAAKIIEMIPFNRILSETDAPYQTSKEEMRNCIDKISEIKGISKDETLKIIFQNFENFNK